MSKTTTKVVRIVSTLVLIAVIVLATVFIIKKRKDTITFGTGGTKGMYYQHVIELEEIEKDKFNIRVRETEGSMANLRLIQQGYLDVAIVQNDTLYDAINGYDEYKDKAIGDERSFSAVTYLYTEAVQVVVKKDSGIKSITDLKDKRVSVGQEESGVFNNAIDVLSVYGISLDDITYEHLNFEDSAEALENGNLDAFFITAGPPTAAISHLFEEGDTELLSIPEEDVDRLKTINPAYVNVTIPAGTYKGQTSDVQTLGVYAVLVVSKKLGEDTVYEITKDIFENSAKMNDDIATDGEIKPEQVPDSMVIPFHKGAAKYYKEKSVDVKVDEAE